MIVLAWIGLALGLVVAIVVVLLFSKIMRPALEIERYSRDILDAGLGITRNLDGVDEAVRTRDLATAVPGLAVAYLTKLGKI
ncbi:MAG: hypothetical protein H0X21_03205 [Actinobacteria bacterium]|nr:hypothetical protein [Actinomycetota bacterium]